MLLPPQTVQLLLGELLNFTTRLSDTEPNYDLSLGSIARESAIWLIVYLAWISWEACPLAEEARIWTRSGFWWKNLLPQHDNSGWGSLSFVSCVTGLNLAIVKLQSFLKTQEDAQRRWTREAVARVRKKSAELSVAEGSASKFEQAAARMCEKILDDINVQHRGCWVFWSRFAVRMVIVGFLCLIFQYSAGIMFIPLLAPIIATWILGWRARKSLFGRMDAVHDLSPEFLRVVHDQSRALEEGLSKGLTQAQQNVAIKQGGEH